MPEKQYLDSISKLEIIKNKIQKSDSSLSTSNIVRYCYPMRDMIIGLKPTIKNQLHEYWNAYVDIAKEINKTKTDTSIDAINKGKSKQMEIINVLHHKTVEKIRDNQPETSHLYALFYFHVLKVDTFENPFKKPFLRLVKKYNLTDKYDVNSIFSIKNKVKTIKKKPNDEEYITDIRAVRNCLAHFLYIIMEEEERFIHFKSGDNVNDRMIYDVLFSRNELYNFLNDANIIYQSMHMLISLLSAITHFKPFAKESLQIHYHEF